MLYYGRGKVGVFYSPGLCCDRRCNEQSRQGDKGACDTADEAIQPLGVITI